MEDYSLYLSGLAGTFGHIGFKYISDLTKYKKNFELTNKNFGWKYHLFISTFVFLLICLLIPIKDGFSDIFPMTIATVFTYTYVGESMIKNTLNKK